MIRLSEVTVARGANRIVEGLTAEIPAGRVFWVIGTNGAGKTSLLQTIAGLAAPRSGSVERVLEPGQSLLYFQSEMSLPPASTVSDWERLVERIGGRAGWSGRTPLWPRVPGARRVSRLSTGEHRRLLLDALLRQPGPVILDEPFEHLSPDAKADLRTLLDRRARDHVVVVATNQGVHRARHDGGLLLEAGSVRPLGTDRGSVRPGEDS